MSGNKKLRYRTWYWGRYIEKVDGKWISEDGKPFPVKYVSESEYEPYVEELHGSHLDPDPYPQ